MVIFKNEIPGRLVKIKKDITILNNFILCSPEYSTTGQCLETPFLGYRLKTKYICNKYCICIIYSDCLD